MLTVVWVKSHAIFPGSTGCCWLILVITPELSQGSIDSQVALPPLTAKKKIHNIYIKYYFIFSWVILIFINLRVGWK